MVSKVLIYVVEGVIGYLRSGKNCIASATLPLKLIAQRRIPAILIGCDEVEGEEEQKWMMMRTDDIYTLD